MFKPIIAAFAGTMFAGTVVAELAPISLHAGVNAISNIAGDGKSGSISVDWRENGNAWGYSIFMVRAGGSVATVEDEDRFTARPHTGEDAVSTVRFARGAYKGKTTTFAVVANRETVQSVPDPAPTIIRTYALKRNNDKLGTPYQFVKLSEFHTKRRYCHADMALKTELQLALPSNYDGPRTLDGC